MSKVSTPELAERITTQGGLPQLRGPHVRLDRSSADYEPPVVQLAIKGLWREILESSTS